MILGDSLNMLLFIFCNKAVKSSRMNQVKQTDSNISSNVQIHTGKILNMTPSEASLACLKADLPTTELGEVTILPLLLF